MRTMKDSRIEWIGQIPTDWKIVRIKYAIEQSADGIKIGPFGSALSNKTISDGKYNVYSQANLISCDFSKTKNTIAEETYESLMAYRVVPGDICVSMMGTIGKCKKVPQKIGAGIMDSHLIKIRLSDNILPEYFEYVYDKDLGGICFQQMMYLKKGTIMDGLNTSIVKQLVLPLADINTQRRIVDYLDRKCSQIDAIVTRQQEVIEKLKAYKLSIITEAVTKGLNPNVPMKDSGVEWIGAIPEHWKMVRLKFLLSHIIDCPHETPIYSADGDYLVIRTADQDLGKLRAAEDMYRLDEGEYQNRIRRMPLEKDDIVYGREGERWGLACFVPESNKYCLGQRMLQFRCKKESFLPRFAMWALNSRFVYLQGAVDTIGSTSPHVNISTVRNFLIPVPDIDEQQEIAEHIDKKMLQLDKEVEHRELLICKLNEYKKSLIYEFVTGKRCN